MNKSHNIFVYLLRSLEVRHTYSFSNKYFNEHPHTNNLFGLSQMLSDYGILNAGTQIVDKETALFDIELPFIAHLNDFIVVYKIECDKAHCFWKIVIPVSQFIQSWSGVILLAETTPDSIEPDYHEHRKKELIDIIQQLILALAVIMILGITFLCIIYLRNR